MMNRSILIAAMWCTAVAHAASDPVREPALFVKNLERGKKQVVVAYGTSLTAHGAWARQLADVLDTRYPGLATVVNSGGSGQWSEWGVRNLDRLVIQKNPDAVFIEFGINDSVERFKGSVEVARANLETMIQRIRAGNPMCEIILMTMTPGDKYPRGHRSYRKDIEKHYEMYRSVAEQRNLLLVDHYRNWKALRSQDKDLFLKYVPDTIHPTATGCSEVVTPVNLDALGIDTTPPRSAERSRHKAPRYYRQVERAPAKTIGYDVVVYGGTPAGVTAAIQAARMGKKTVLLSFNRHVGGLTSGGLTATDIGNRAAIGGMAMEFYNRIGKIKDFRPSEAESLFLEMLAEADVPVLLGRCLESVEQKDGRLTSATMETGETFKALMFVDATYEGDLLAAAQVSYQVGREPAAAYGESLAGQWSDGPGNYYQFCRLPISPYVKPGDPNSGLLPEISAEPPGKPGDGDFKVQAYNFRMHLTDKAGKVPFPKPPEYDPGRYALLARFLNADPKLRWTLNYTTKPMTDGPVQMRNGDSNNAGSFSSDYLGGNYRWPDGTYEPDSFEQLPTARRGLPMPFRELYELRERIFQDHLTYQQGLVYFLANDPEVPAGLRQRVNRFGLDPREFQETGFWPHQLYVREGRRMVSSYVMTQANGASKRTVSDSVGLASYTMDSHHCQRAVVDENGMKTIRNDGNFNKSCPKPYPVSYRSIVAKKEECPNLLVPVCLSASHVAYGSIRMEPVFMILGQSAGTAAALAIDGQVDLQELPYEKLKAKLESDGQILKGS